LKNWHAKTASTSVSNGFQRSSKDWSLIHATFQPILDQHITRDCVCLTLCGCTRGHARGRSSLYVWCLGHNERVCACLSECNCPPVAQLLFGAS
jgi:hypothetical protein